LEKAGTTASLNPFLDLQDESLKKGSQQKNAEDLTDLKEYVGENHDILPSRSQT
jgi:hypothetical protein